MEVYVDDGPGMRSIGEVAAWSFDLDQWGECAQGSTERDALSRLARRIGYSEATIVERTDPADSRQVFRRDLQPASEEEIETTARILREQRARTLDLVADASPDVLVARDSTVAQPRWMTWRTAEAIAWHIADTESRFYLDLLGCGRRDRDTDLMRELVSSGTWVQEILRTLPRDARREVGGELWTTVKVLRRLAWHERVESVFLRRRLGR